MMKKIVCAGTALLSLGAVLAAEHVFPQVPWNELKVGRADASAVYVVDATGRTLFELHSEPSGLMAGVTVTPRADRLEIAPAAAFKAGARKIVTVSAPIEDPAFQQDDVCFQVLLSGPVGGSIETYVQMLRKNRQGRPSFAALVGCNGNVATPTRARAFTHIEPCRGETSAYRLRFDLKAGTQSTAPFAFWGGRMAAGKDFAALPSSSETMCREPELLFHASFDGDAKADFARGAAEPRLQRALTYAPGMKGKAVHLSSAARSALDYAFKGNVQPRAGTVSMWVKRDADAWASSARRWLFASPLDFNARFGTGALFFWIWDRQILRGDVSDNADSYATRAIPVDDAWHHVAFFWRDDKAGLAVDGQLLDHVTETDRPLTHARYTLWRDIAARDFGADGAFDSFSLGSYRGGEAFDGLIDEVTVWSGPLNAEQIRKLWREGGGKPPAPPDYATLAAQPNPHLGGVAAKAGVPENLELVASWTADDMAAAPKFAAVGPWRKGRLGATTYLEAGSNQYDRLAFGFSVDPSVPLHVLEIDYPDDTFRTSDYIVQDALNPHDDYTLQVGVATGRDYPTSGTIRTHRCLYWTRSADLAFLALTCNPGAPAAVAALRLYRVKDGRLPVAAMHEPPKRNGWGRVLGQYWEDPAMNYDFSIADPASPTGVVAMAQRVAALMKFTGENLYAYPGAWYGGLIDANGYNPRTHAPEFLRAFYEVFDREGLGFVPLLNQHYRTVPSDLVTYAKLRRGGLHDSMFSVFANGHIEKPGIRGPAQFNLCHPDMQRYLEGEIDALLAQGVRHPSFKGIGLHVKHPGLEWFGSLEGGYNDYCIDAFTRATGIAVPVDRTDPLRGKAYHAWLMAHAREAWIQWRCDVVTGFWVRMAKKLVAARPDLKLWVNNITDIDPIIAGFRDERHVRDTMRAGGLDADRFAREAPNVVLGQSMFPADSRFLRPTGYYPTLADVAHQRVMHRSPHYWDFIKKAPYPLAHQHDRYFEIDVGDPRRNPNPARRFNCAWLKEHPWRVSTVNPAGRNALEWYALPLRFQDVLGLTKGGYLVGTYGMEEVLAPFAQAFRALPPVVMDTVTPPGALQVVRRATYEGRVYVYAVNTVDHAAEVDVDLPAGAKDLVTGETFPGPTRLKLAAYELRAFASPLVP